MATMRPTPRNELLGLLSDAYKWMQSPERAQQMQGFAGLLGTTGVPQTVERMAYGEPLTNIGRANVPLLKPETADALMTVAPFAPKGMKMIRATEGMPVGMSIKPINLNKGIYKPELTMEEMLKVKDIPTVDRVRQSIDLVGEKEFEKMVNAQYSKYKPSDVDQEAMLVESVTLNILGKAQRSPYPQQAPLSITQQRSSLLDMTRTPSEAEIKKMSREDLIDWLQNNDPNGQYMDPTPNPSISMYRTGKGYAVENADSGDVFEFKDFNEAQNEFNSMRFSNAEFPPMTLQDAQESAINYLREFAQPEEGAKVLQFGKKQTGLLGQ